MRVYVVFYILITHIAKEEEDEVISVKAVTNKEMYSEVLTNYFEFASNMASPTILSALFNYFQ